jgi:hypothetical protein
MGFGGHGVDLFSEGRIGRDCHKCGHFVSFGKWYER